MDNLDDSENNAKISDSAYSNSCSNSQSRRSRSSKSTRSGSNSSGSSGYGGKQSTSGSSNNLRKPPIKRTQDKDVKKIELTKIQDEAEFRLPEPAQPKKGVRNDAAPSVALQSQDEKGVQDMVVQETNAGEDTVICHTSQCAMQVVASRNTPTDGFSCVISINDGVVMNTTSSLTNTVGFPKDMWIGRSFIDFIHPLDHSTFASQITNSLSVPKRETQSDSVQPGEAVSTMFCRIRKYRGLAASFGVKDRSVAFIPFTLKLIFKNDDGDNGMFVYLIIQATPLNSAFKSAHEILAKAVSFVMRHVSNGNLEHIDPEAVPLLGYFPQDVTGIDVLRLYHPDDLTYMRQIYETIVTEGAAPRSKPYRLMAQNGDYLKLETEWTSFVNPWSHKLEFVVAKHHVLEGPANPDVFQPPVVRTGRERRSVGEERNKAQCLREHIVRIMNKVLTKPAEFAKQQMSKRCKDLASYMESLTQEPPKADPPERAIEVPGPSHSCEQDSEILGGISPHHDYCSDGKSSSETPLSYNQLNFNDNLQRFFDNHQELTYEEYQQAIAGHLKELKNTHTLVGGRLSPMALYSTDSADLTSSGESSSGPYSFKKQRESSVRLTESLLSRHNTDMEKSLVKKHRICRAASKEEREKASYATKQKKKEHLARCNASFVPTSVKSSSEMSESQPHGLKRSSKQMEEQSSSRKHHCSGQRPLRRKHAGSPESSSPGSYNPDSPAHRARTRLRKPTPYSVPATGAAPHVTHMPTGMAASYRPPSLNDMIPFVPNIGLPPHATYMTPLPAGQGLIPFFYVPANAENLPSTSAGDAGHRFSSAPVQYLMYGPAVVGSPIMVSPISRPPFPMQENLNQYTANRNINTTRSTPRNYEQAPPDRTQMSERRNESGNETGNSDEAHDRTDGESSYSSFYSSFFKTDSGSADDSDYKDNKNDRNRNDNAAAVTRKENVKAKVVRRKIEPPWMEQVCATPELIYKYQIKNKDINEVLASDRKKLASLDQPSLVNEQLGQLYTDLQLEGVAARLTLEEGQTSSSSSGEESKYNSPAKRMKKKREYTKLVMIYEEDAPMPPPFTDSDMPSTSLS